jgi:hypothetical protein
MANKTCCESRTKLGCEVGVTIIKSYEFAKIRTYLCKFLDVSIHEASIHEEEERQLGGGSH